LSNIALLNKSKFAGSLVLFSCHSHFYTLLW